MTTAAQTTTTPVVSQPATATQAGTKRLAENFDTFLQLLTTQLQNQDPLDPLDTNQFTQQLVQFTGVEQQLQTNQNLESLISLQSGNNFSAVAAGYLGRDVTASTNQAALTDGGATWTYELGGTAADTKLVIKDTRGNVVQSLPGELNVGSHKFTWDGKLANGNAAPPGVYRLDVQAKSGSDTDITSRVTVTGRVSAVEQSGVDTKLIVNGAAINTKDILKVIEPTATPTPTANS